MKYRKFTGIVLKKQNFREADQIVTVYTKELGKMRCVAKSLRSSKSKLSGSFQDLSLVEFEVTGSSGLPTLISAKTQESFSKLKIDLTKTAIAFYGIELLIKITPDEQVNIESFNLLLEFLRQINSMDTDETKLYACLDNFSLRLLEVLGFSTEFAHEHLKLPPKLLEIVEILRESDFPQTMQLQIDDRSMKQIHKAVSQFVEYILERNIKSNLFLTSI